MEHKTKLRSRKSKLVPRDYIDSEDDDENLALMQEEIEKEIASITMPSILNRISSKPASTNCLEFSVKVEVEECPEFIPDHNEIWDNSNICDDDNSLNIRIDSVTSIKEEEPGKSIGFECINQKICHTISDDELKAECDALSLETTSYADKLIEINLKNNFGEREIAIKEDALDIEIQEKLKRWRNWAETQPEIREAPLMYVCCACDEGWWHYSEFRKHIEIHEGMLFRIEITNNDLKLLAYLDKFFEQPINVEDDCPRCLQHHTMHQKASYICDGCYKILPTCTLLSYHEAECSNYLQKIRKTTGVDAIKMVSCKICPFKHWSSDMLRKHLENRHTVRSDYPMYWFSKRCQKCNMKLNDPNIHNCQRKALTEICVHCLRRFPSKLLLNLHINNSKKFVSPCKICAKELEWGCKEAEHLTEHSNNYILTYKCTLCKEPQYYNNELTIKDHMLTKHRNNKICEEKVILPKRLLEKLPQMSTEVVPIAPIATRNFYKSTKRKANSGTNIAPAGIVDTKQSIDTNVDNEGVNGEMGVRVMVIKNENVQNILNFSLDKIEAEKMEKSCANRRTNKRYSTKLDPNVQLCDMKNNFVDVEIKQEFMDMDPVNDIPIGYFDDGDDGSGYQIKEEPLDVVDDVDDFEIDDEISLGETSNDSRRSRVKETNEKKQKPTDTYGDYLCTKCDIISKTFHKYLEHFSQHHGYEPKTCPECFKEVHQHQYLKDHVYSHIKNIFVKIHSIKDHSSSIDMKYQCKKCKEHLCLSDFFEHWEGHLRIVEGMSTEVEFVVNMDDKPILKQMLVILLSIETGNLKNIEMDMELRACIKCGKKFDRRNDCKRHYIEYLLCDAYKDRHIHGYLKCQICGVGFQNRNDYKLHMREHGSLPVYTCELCNKSFSNSSNFSKHKKLHSKSVFECDICQKRFNTKKCFVEHVQMHKVTKPIRCADCARIFYTQSSFKKHMKKIFFGCPACKIKFLSPKEKWEHMWEAHKERKYEADCPICSKPFRKYYDVKQHLKVVHKMPNFEYHTSTNKIFYQRNLKTIKDSDK